MTLVGEERVASRPTAHLRLTPKANAQAAYRQVDLWVDRELGIPIQQQFIETNQNQTVLRFHDVRVNTDVPDSHFTVKVPPDVERVRG